MVRNRPYNDYEYFSIYSLEQKKLVFVSACIFLLIILFLFSPTNVSAAGNITVRKSVNQTSINAGDSVAIQLEITNTFNKDVTVRIADINTLGNNGLDIQCLQATAPAGKTSVLKYQPVEAYSPGKYTLGKAQVNYISPDSGNKEAAYSNSIQVNVVGKSSGQAKGVTTIYRCNGVNMQSTSYSSSGSSIQVYTSSSSSSPSQQRSQQQQNAQQNPASSVQSHQMNQDAQALKKQFEEQQRQQEMQRQQLEKKIASNPQVRDENSNLQKQGFNLTSANYSASSNSTGNFTFKYKNSNNETAMIKGRMQNGTLSSLHTLTSKMKQEMMNQLYKNSQYNKYNSSLQGQGFAMQQPQFSFNGNNTDMIINYTKGNETANLTAQFNNQSLQRVSLQKPTGRSNAFIWWILALLIAVIAAIIIYKRYKSQNSIVVLEKSNVAVPKRDYRKSAIELLQEAKSSYYGGNKKDGFIKLSQAVRTYYAGFMGLEREITNLELLKRMRRSQQKGYKEVKAILNVCSEVEFAKAPPSGKEFEKGFSLASDIIR